MPSPSPLGMSMFEPSAFPRLHQPQDSFTQPRGSPEVRQPSGIAFNLNQQSLNLHQPSMSLGLHQASMSLGLYHPSMSLGLYPSTSLSPQSANGASSQRETLQIGSFRDVHETSGPSGPLSRLTSQHSANLSSKHTGSFSHTHNDFGNPWPAEDEESPTMRKETGGSVYVLHQNSLEYEEATQAGIHTHTNATRSDPPSEVITQPLPTALVRGTPTTQHRRDLFGQSPLTLKCDVSQTQIYVHVTQR